MKYTVANQRKPFASLLLTSGRPCSQIKTLNNPIETVGAEDAGVLVNKDSLILSFGRHYRRCPTAVYFAKSRHKQVILTSSSEGKLILFFSRLCVNFSHPSKR